MKKSKKSKLNLLLKIGICTGAFGLGATAITSCSYTTKGVMTFFYGATKLLENNNSPLGIGFVNSPISTYAASILLGLTNYQTVNNYKFGETTPGTPSTDVVDTIKDVLILEGAKAVIVFANENVQKAFNTKVGIDLSKKDDGMDAATNQKYLDAIKNIANDNSSITSTSGDTEVMTSFSASNDVSASGTGSSGSTTYTEGKDYWILLREKGGIEFQKGLKNNNDTTGTSTYYSNAISNGTVYQFLIDTQNWWVDMSGNKMQQLSGKDFERVIEAYVLSSDLNYNRNGYFLDLLSLDFQKTAGDRKTITKDGESVHPDVTDPEYDINDYVNENDNFFSLYIDGAYPYALSLLSKEFFNALPHTNPRVTTISMASGTPIKTTKDEKGNDTGVIDQAATDWTKIYGAGGLGVFNVDAWSAGSYYFSNFTSTVMELTTNKYYFDSIGKDLLAWNNYKNGDLPPADPNDNEKKIEKLVLFYGSGTPDTYYEMFKSGQVDYAPVPTIRQNEAIQLYGSNPDVIYPTKVVQTTQSNYISYTPRPYIANLENNIVKITPNDYISQNAANFISDWNSEYSTTIRAAIAGLVNYYQLSLINLTSSGDFQLSGTPYGVFPNYYEAVASDLFNGGLPRSYTDYTDGSGNTLGEFKIPYYTYTNNSTDSANAITIKDLTINQQTFQDALKHYGASTSSPLILSAKFGEGSFSTNYNSFLVALKQTIESLGGGLVQFNINQRNSPNPTTNEWYYNQASPIGFSYWSPDYNAVGTWIEAETTINTGTVAGQSMETVTGTNAHNAWLTFLSSMVTAANLMKAEWTADSSGQDSSGTGNTTGKYTVKTLPTSDPFAQDTRIQSTFDIYKNVNGTTIADKLGIAKTTRNSSGSDSTYSDADAANDEATMKPGHRYGLLAIGLLNKLISEGVFDQSKFDAYVKDPSKLKSVATPTTLDQLYIGHDIVKSNQSGSFSKWIGVYAGESTLKALYENFIIDSDYYYITRSEAGLKEISYSLKSPQYVIRNGTQQVNYRDYGMSGDNSSN
ncbi:MAG: hypothetical protein HUJ42_01820 [Malacoplasma sp.]|nr:hypothetical protein [Malacoplasma sp.]